MKTKRVKPFTREVLPLDQTGSSGWCPGAYSCGICQESRWSDAPGDIRG